MSMFLSVFKDNNDWNEKSIVGGLSFAMMVITAVVDVAAGVWGIDLSLQKFIYNSFLIVTLGSFGIAGFESVLKSRSE